MEASCEGSSSNPDGHLEQVQHMGAPMYSMQLKDSEVSFHVYGYHVCSISRDERGLHAT